MPLFQSLSRYIENIQDYINEETDICTKELLKIYKIKISDNPTNMELLMVQDDLSRLGLNITFKDKNNINIREIILSQKGKTLYKYEIKRIYDDIGVKVSTKLIK